MTKRRTDTSKGTTAEKRYRRTEARLPQVARLTRKVDELGALMRRLAGSQEPRSARAATTSWEVGKVYLIRTVTMIDTGRLVGVTEHELVLEEAAWIADTGRFADAVRKAEFGEVEPFPDGRVIVGRGAVVDAVQITLTQRSQR